VRSIETEERTGEVSASSADGGAAGSVVPGRRGVALADLGETDEELLDEQPVIEDDVGEGLRHLLVGQIRVLDAGDAGLVAVSEHAAKLASSSLDAARNDQGGIAEVDDPDLAATFDAPPVAELRRQVGLPAM
jgi:hypothetical protein